MQFEDPDQTWFLNIIHIVYDRIKGLGFMVVCRGSRRDMV